MPSGSGDRWPEDYELGRPSWPPEALDATGIPATATVLDLGAGTGKLTRLLVERFSHVIATEPAPAMRRVLEGVCPGAEVHEGADDDIPLTDASVDAVFAAQAFHWFDGVDEIVRVLRPDGALVAMFNGPDTPVEPPIDDALAALRERMPSALDYDPLDLGHGHRPELPQFAPFEHVRLRNEQRFDRESLVAFYASMGWVADLADDERLPLLEAFRARLHAHAYVRVWACDVYWSRLR
jgi:SAM-dependent methyltransferase